MVLNEGGASALPSMLRSSPVDSTRRADIVAILSGDSDLLPALNMAKDTGVIVRLVHGPRDTYHNDLWDAADERKQMSPELIARCRHDH